MMKGICKLCHQDKQLCESHILSKFIFKPMKKEGGIEVLSTDPHQKNIPVQDGFKQYLFCRECEGRRNKWETYFSHKLHRGKFKGQTYPLTVTGLDYNKVKLFLMSTLFAASVSDHPYLSRIELDSSAEETLRRMLFAEDPGEPHDFGCRVIAIEEGQNGQVDIVTNPVSFVHAGATIHHLVFSGFLFQFVEHAEYGIGQDLVERFLTMEGTIIIQKMKLSELQVIMRPINKLFRQGKLDG